MASSRRCKHTLFYASGAQTPAKISHTVRYAHQRAEYAASLWMVHVVMNMRENALVRMICRDAAMRAHVLYAYVHVGDECVENMSKMEHGRESALLQFMYVYM